MITILNQFKEYTESLQSLTKMQKIPRLMTADKFKELVNVQLREILRFQISSDNDNKNSKDIFKEISKTKIPASLEKLLKSVVECLVASATENNEIVTKLKEQLNEINRLENDPQAKFIKMQQCLKYIIENAAIKKIIDNKLLEQYLATQQHYDPLSSKPINESVSSYFQQMQAEPLKRAGFIMFMALFECLDQMMYLSTNGQMRLSNIDYGKNDSSEEESALQKLWRQQQGVPYPKP